MSTSAPEIRDNISLNPKKIKKIPEKMAKKWTTLTSGFSGWKATGPARTGPTPSQTPISSKETFVSSGRVPFAGDNIFRVWGRLGISVEVLSSARIPVFASRIYFSRRVKNFSRTSILGSAFDLGLEASRLPVHETCLLPNVFAGRFKRPTSEL